ncbi:MAG: ATP-binding protein, partial [Dehalococcoidia bacterium]|nr:ATP-binding protein [Dehalococcoidia bacterium]
MTEPIRVTSDVGRDLLASAAQFKTEPAVVWEYVSNSLQYVDEGTIPRIQVYVRPRAKRIEIIDNGTGMTEQGLKHFFQMHGKNIDRLRGNPGRGRWGMGKSAAFGIAEVLQVDSVRNGIRNVVQLDRATIDDSTGEDIDVEWLVKNEEADSPNGTTVTIDRIVLPKLNAAPVIDYIERHLQVFRGIKPEIAINDHYCEYKEPVVASTHAFHPSDTQASVLGDIELVVNASQAPLPKMEQGITVTAGVGNLLAIESLGVETKELGNYLFGSVDVPALESFKSPIQPIDPSRSLQLNPQHPVARVLLPFIGSSLEEVRKLRTRELRAKQRSEEARRLALVAD